MKKVYKFQVDLGIKPDQNTGYEKTSHSKRQLNLISYLSG